MGELSDIVEIIQQSGNPLTSLLTVFAYVFLLIFIFKTVYGWFLELYNKKHGKESKEENTEKTIQELRDAINGLKELHEQDINKLKHTESDDIRQIKESIDQLTKSVQETNDKINKVSERDKHTNQAVLRSDIIRIYNELEHDNWNINPTTKENLDHLFESYFENEGNGLVKSLKKEYDKHIHVDYSNL